MQKPKVIITSSKKTGGVRTFSQALASALSHLGYECTLVDSIQELLKPAMLHQLRQPGVVLISSLGFGVFNLFARSSIYVLHGFPRLDDAGWFGFIKVALATKIFSRWATRVTAISQLTYLANAAFFGIRSHRIIGNPFISQESLTRKEARNEIIRVLYVGRLVGVKRVEQIVRGFLLAVQQEPRLHLEIVGSGPEEHSLRKLADHPSISFAGSMPNSEALAKMSQSDIFISLAEGEPFGITFVEALASGCYLVCPTSGGHLDWVVDYPQVAYVKNIFDPKEVAESILEAVKKLDCPRKPLDAEWNLNVARKYDALILEAVNEKARKSIS